MFAIMNDSLWSIQFHFGRILDTRILYKFIIRVGFDNLAVLPKFLLHVTLTQNLSHQQLF